MSRKFEVMPRLFLLRTLSIFFFIGAVFFPALQANAAMAATTTSPFFYSFNVPGTLYVTTTMEQSSSPYFWISSGARLIIKDGIGETIQGPLSISDPQKINYNRINPLDTDNGYYPQNTFRLVSRSKWGNEETSVKFFITKTNLTNTPNRDGYSGIFIEGRYIDKDNLYYVGVRQDGLAILKKKIGGVYYTLAYKQVFGTAGSYNKSTNPNLIPQKQWMGLKARFTNRPDNSVEIELLLDSKGNGNWTSLVSFTDKNTGGTPFTNPGYTGVRTDYMDVQFDNLQMANVSVGPLVSFNFDDGWQSGYDYGLPILNAAGFKATSYIITGKLNTPRYMTTAEVLDTQAKGNEIGAHTRSHPHLAQLSDALAKTEIAGSKQDLLDMGISQVTTFAYPYGDFNSVVEQTVKDAGFAGARTTNPGVNDNATDPFQLYYIGMNASSTLSSTTKAIDDAVTKKKWIIFVFHRINDSEYENVSGDFVKQVVDYVKSKNIPVVTTAQGIGMLPSVL